MIKPTEQQLQGVWENEDNAPFNYNKKYNLTFFIGHLILSLEHDKDDKTVVIADGNFTVADLDEFRFKLKIENSEHKGSQDIICRMYIDKNPSSFVATIPGYPDLYFVRK
ncbi:hypothetical protein NLG42_19615 [Flavobacterium plurextorum]|uniref:hypothetical protein n=1 Tax=Flavobacterium TaxID=237 RepID=UPI00214D92EE|nr:MULTISPECIES: hypothetical protein [Flavobacterium]UUW08303.1 hypothetical protein NLG42_19615 [Flavobacterium plurextorum]